MKDLTEALQDWTNSCRIWKKKGVDVCQKEGTWKGRSNAQLQRYRFRVQEESKQTLSGSSFVLDQPWLYLTGKFKVKE